jgi:thiol:disulfide interchange protein DsbG
MTLRTLHALRVRRFALLAPLIAAMALTLAACSQQDAPAASTAAKVSTPAQSYDAVASGTKGFTVGAMMSANTVYVMFDPQCPHCGHLWQAAQPLLKKVKFVWVPVAFIGPKSAPQGAALLSAANPLELMTTHEASILAGTGGISASASIAADIEAGIKANTQLLNRMGVESVPFIIAKNLSTGQVVTNTGALQTADLAKFLGVDAP